MADDSRKQLLRFGVFELDLDAGELRKQGVRLHLQPKPLHMLATRLESPGEIVTLRRGQVLGARFTSDGQGIVYSAQWDRDQSDW